MPYLARVFGKQRLGSIDLTRRHADICTRLPSRLSLPSPPALQRIRLGSGIPVPFREFRRIRLTF
jgi:hypothetical protein